MVEIGTGLKFNVSMNPIDGYHLANVDFKVEVFSSMGGKTMSIPKSNAMRMDDDNYIICVDSAEIGLGKYYLTLFAYIPDADFPSGIRAEGATIETDVVVTRRNR